MSIFIDEDFVATEARNTRGVFEGALRLRIESVRALCAPKAARRGCALDRSSWRCREPPKSPCYKPGMQLTALSDDALISSLRALCSESRRIDARLVEHLGEVEERSLHLKAACSSMLDFCVRKLGMSASSAFRRINAARLVRRFPSILGHLERGEVHLSGLVVLAKHLTANTVEELLTAVAGMSQQDLETFLAGYAPRPDVPDRISKLGSQQGPSLLDVAARPADRVAAPLSRRIEPLSEERFRVELTASRELRDKLERARDLMRHRNASGELAVVVERALDMLLEKLEAERLGKTKRVGRTARGAKRGTIARAVRREVFERDGEQCTFRSEDGSRCPARALLELDHVIPRATRGPDDASNLRVRCRAHNRFHAEEIFGKEHVARQIDFRRRKFEETGHRNDHGEASRADTFDLALRGLVNLGFAKSAAERTLAELAQQRDHVTPAVADLLRDAIRALT